MLIPIGEQGVLDEGVLIHEPGDPIAHRQLALLLRLFVVALRAAAAGPLERLGEIAHVVESTRAGSSRSCLRTARRNRSSFIARSQTAMAGPTSAPAAASASGTSSRPPNASSPIPAPASAPISAATISRRARRRGSGPSMKGA